MAGEITFKAALRRQMRRQLDELSEEQKENESALIRNLLTFTKNERVALFAGTPNEPQLLTLIGDFPEVQWFLPKVLGDGEMDFVRTINISSLKPGAFGIKEPTTGEIAADLDCIICPGLAFTNGGRRLGQGGGFYDRALPKFPNARRIGVAFSCQLLPELPTEDHDCQMDVILNLSSESKDENREP